MLNITNFSINGFDQLSSNLNSEEKFNYVAQVDVLLTLVFLNQNLFWCLPNIKQIYQIDDIWLSYVM